MHQERSGIRQNSDRWALAFLGILANSATARLSLWLLVALASLGCGRKPLHEGRDVAELERLLHDANPTVQAQAAFGLSLHGAEAQSATASLIQALAAADALVRQQAAVALAKIGPGAEQATPALVKALEDAEWSVRRQAAMALGSIAAPLSVAEAPLQRAERDASALVRKAARESLAILRKQAKK